MDVQARPSTPSVPSPIRVSGASKRERSDLQSPLPLAQRQRQQDRDLICVPQQDGSVQSPLIPGMQEMLDGVPSPGQLIRTDMGYGVGVPTGEVMALAAELRETREAMRGLASVMRDQYMLQLELAAAELRNTHGR